MKLIPYIKDRALVSLKKRNKNVIVTKKLTNYIEDLASTTLEQKYLDAYAKILSLPNGSYQTPLSEVLFLNMLIKVSNSLNILEIGTFKGFTALLFANTSQNCKVTTLELNEDNAKDAKNLWADFGVEDRITLLEGEASLSLDKLHTQGIKFDFVYIDANKSQYPLYLEKSLTLLNTNGQIVIDNALWAGLVAEQDTGYSHAKILDALNRDAFEGFGDVTLIPAWDGVLIIRP